MSEHAVTRAGGGESDPSRRSQYLGLLGITQWRSRFPPPSPEAPPAPEAFAGEHPPTASAPMPAPDPEALPGAGPPVAVPAPAGEASPGGEPPVAPFPASIAAGEALPGREPAVAPVPARTLEGEAAPGRSGRSDVQATAAGSPPGRQGALAEVGAEVAVCTRCDLHRTRNRTVFGVGAHDARCMIIGEAPGADEDRQGEPFVGRAGRLLNSMLAAAGMDRESVYIANIIKCRPPRNRDPSPEEVRCCTRYLERQIELVAPSMILASGRVAAQNLLDTTTSIGRLRGRTHEHRGTGIPVVATYHPAYLLRSPHEKRKVWEDLKRTMRLLGDAG